MVFQKGFDSYFTDMGLIQQRASSGCTGWRHSLPQARRVHGPFSFYFPEVAFLSLGAKSVAFATIQWEKGQPFFLYEWVWVEPYPFTPVSCPKIRTC